MESEIALPGLISNSKPGGPSAVSIVRASVPTKLENPAYEFATWQIAGRELLLRVPGVARFLLSDGTRIACEAEPGSDPADLPIFVLGTVFGILLHQRGETVLHASAVRVGGHAVLFCGGSGAGKSTIAAALAQRGFPLVTDDVCAVSAPEGAAPMIFSDGRQLKLWEQSIKNLELGERRGGRVRQQLEKFYVEPDIHANQPLPLGAIYALREQRVPLIAGIEQPNVVDAALLLRRNAYRPLLVSRLEQHQHYFHAATRIANAAGIFYLTRELDFAKMPEVIARLEQHWRELGLMEKAA